MERLREERGFTLIEAVIAMIIMSVMIAGLYKFLDLARNASGRDSAITELDGLGEQVMQRITLDLRNNLRNIEEVNIAIPGDSYPVVVDGWIFRSMDNEIIGYGLRPLDRNRDGVQDAVDADLDGQPDDVNEDGRPDWLFRLVRVLFPPLPVAEDQPVPQSYKDDNYWNPDVWERSNILISEHLAPVIGTITLANPPEEHTTYNTFEFLGKPEFDATKGIILFDWGFDNLPGTGDEGELDGRVEEWEVGNIQNGNGWIDHLQEIAEIASIRVNLHLEKTYRRNRVNITHVTSEIHPRNLRTPL